MSVAVLDTSVLVRYLTGDNSVKAASARSYFRAASDDSLLMPDVGVAELTFVLLRVYRWPVASVAQAIRAVVNHRAILVPGKQLWLAVADDIEHGRGPVDAYLLRTAEHAGIPNVLTFDEDIIPIPGVGCIAP